MNERFFKDLKLAAENIGMMVNDKKTQLLCISGNNGIAIEMSIRPSDGTKIKNQSTLKQLGFIFGDRPMLDAHIEYISSKFRRKLWYLRHIKKASCPAEDLVRLYKCFLVSILDFAAVVYHPILTQEQSDMLEKLQKSALRIIFNSKRVA